MARTRWKAAVHGGDAGWARAELPFLALYGLSLLASVAVLAQDGGWALALLACPVVLAVPGAAIEMMLGVARAALWLEGGAVR